MTHTVRGPSRPLFAILATATLALCSSLKAQGTTTASPQKMDPAARALADLVALMEVAESPTTVAPAVARLATTLGDRQEAVAVRAVHEILRTVTEWKDIDAIAIARLLELTAEHRRGRMEYMAPAVLTLSRVAPDSPEVLAATFELFGVASAIFDVAKAVSALGRIEEIMPASTDATPDILAKAGKVVRMIGDFEDGWQGLGALWSYWNAGRTMLHEGGTLRLVTASDLRVLEQLPPS